MTQLAMTPTFLISSVLLVISIVSFVVMYNKAIKNRVDKTDLRDLKEYVDQQDRSIHHRVDEVRKEHDSGMVEIRKQLNIIINKLM